MSPNEKTLRKKYHHGELFEAAIDSALSIVRSDGLSALTLRRVAEAVGVNHRALYRHFDTRDVLLAEVAARGFHSFANRIEAEVAPDGDARTQAEEFLKGYLEFWADESNLYECMFSRSARTIQDRETLRAAVKRVTANAERCFRPLVNTTRSGEAVSAEELRDIIITTWATLHGLCQHYETRIIHVRDKEELKKYAFRLVVNGMKPFV